MLEKWL